MTPERLDKSKLKEKPEPSTAVYEDLLPRLARFHILFALSLSLIVVLSPSRGPCPPYPVFAFVSLSLLNYRSRH